MLRRAYFILSHPATLLLLIANCCATLAVMISSIADPWPTPEWLLSAMMVLAAVTPISALLCIVRLIERVKSPWDRERLCESCGYDLQGLPNDDGVCPECGYVWEGSQKHVG